MSHGLAGSLSKIGVSQVPSHEISPSSASANRNLRSFSFALLVGLGYYVGTRIGFGLTPHGEPNSAFWPPNAILLAALLLAPRRMWWAFLLATLPAHLLAQLQADVPLWTAIGWFITNSLEALVGAFCITRFTDQETRFDTVRGVLVFILFGVLVAPLATSFLDAASVVVTGWGHGYWPLGTERFWTNALAELTIAPAIVLAGLNGIFWLRNAKSVRRWEAALLGVSTILIATFAFGFHSASTAATPAVLYLPLPLLLWATVRFRLGGLSLSLLCMALISMWYTMHGRLPFPYASMRQNILSLQILFCMVAVPLMFLSAVMDEAHRTQESLRRIGAKLINAQDQERSRIARELHDDYNQRLAMLAIDLEKLARDIQVPSIESSQRLHEMHGRVCEVNTDLHTLSHSLHSSALETLGLVAGLRAFSEEFAEQQGLEVDFVHGNIPRGVPADAALCLFRVAQEALRNVKRHSRANKAAVQLELLGEWLRLSVSDRGIGFDLTTAAGKAGIGLHSMEERVRVLGGHLEIHSRPLDGTRIDAWVPFHAASERAI